MKNPSRGNRPLFKKHIKQGQNSCLVKDLSNITTNKQQSRFLSCQWPLWSRIVKCHGFAGSRCSSFYSSFAAVPRPKSSRLSSNFTSYSWFKPCENHTLLNLINFTFEKSEIGAMNQEVFNLLINHLLSQLTLSSSITQHSAISVKSRERSVVGLWKTYSMN